MSEPTAGRLRMIESLEAWLRAQPLQDLLPRADADAMLKEVREDQAFWDGARPRFERAWDRAEERLRKEERPARALLSEKAASRLLDGFERLDPDPEAVRTFLRSPAIEATLGSVLYTGIFEFIRRVDLIGNLVNRLPIIGGIRRKVMAAFKEEVETRLEGQIKGFLGGFSGMAVERLIQHVLSDENREGFRKARRRLGEHLLDRPVKSLLPNQETTRRLRDDLWTGLREASLKDESTHLDELYADHGADALGDWSPPLTRHGKALLARNLDRFLATEGGEAWRAELGPG